MRALEISNRELLAFMSEATNFAAEYWASLEERPSYPSTSGSETARLFDRPWSGEGRGSKVLDDVRVIAEHVRPCTGRFFGYVAGSGEPVGAVGDFLTSVFNQNTTSWRSAPAAITIERAVIGWLAEAIGCGGFAGSLCGGGSMANLMGLAIAREKALAANEEGARPGVVYASEQVHMSIPKAIALLGLGRSNLRLIPVDADFRLRTDALEAAIASDRKFGNTPVAIVASVGAVATGAIDPLRQIAEIAKSEGIWLHVDGAFGVLAALAVPEKFEGLNLADSISLDAHKWLYQPIDCGCLLYRDRDAARKTFSHSGDYVRVFNQDPGEAFAFFEESIELSRRFRALKLWLSLQYHGREAYREAISRDLLHAQLLADAVRARPELELLAPVPLSAVCFRHRVKSNEAILQRVIARGRVYLSNASINGHFALRACFVNHRTEPANVYEIVSEVIAAADELNA
ncbi:pyridoxal phosphate-dependent decarboxylase family protein [Mesorhizobium humile]|jgi:glutamate/tyrosine decarboxylase-like PLP-dependent enzyme|uniref:Aminotransferase class V-fold PLP-dependent enzyme n=1 Tax=Mesorhizobium humile TaxID=3072313 RepID=A0ABU4YFM0_9HYPH|nr:MULTISPECIES: aminotransferase class V-fold PLP-dependent enzyme [unclassified Mesorhizobium]MDX8457447.1 aminotransferase class V-fold PLP-dependent enzyme [Mesorhizobium sp. VK2D]MDX8485744.1 aminotransferase class V-fold PLP-dependent enzyme [Mesorhizobium sp. VK2B]